MAGLDVSGFNVPEENFGGLYQAANRVEQTRRENDRLAQEKSSRQTATSKFLADYLDPKEHLTGTNYDPQIVGGFQDVLQKAQDLAAKGANTNDILMAIGPSVSKLNQYSTKAKLINDQVKNSVSKLKSYQGYNTEALQQEALKNAFYGPDGKLKDIAQVDPQQDYVTMAAQNNPELVTTSKGLDDFVNKTPMADYSRNVQTAYAGRTKNSKYEAKHPFWEDLQKDEKGNVAVDATGNPLGLDVEGGIMQDDKGQTISDPATGKPFRAMDKNNFNAIMSHNPDVADYIRGQVNQHFKAAGAKQLPSEGSAQWDMMARHILGDELKTRSRSTFRTIDQQKETAPAIKVEIGQNPGMLKDLQKYEEATKLKGEYSVNDPKTGKAVKTNAVQTVGEIFNNNPAFVQGEAEDLGGRSVINVTSAFPGGGLKTGRGADDVFKSIYYDPQKRTLIVERQDKAKDASGQKQTTLEEIPEAKAGQFMSRIAGANGVDPNKVSAIFDQVGYKGAKFNNTGDASGITANLNEAHAAKVQEATKAVESDEFDKLKGFASKDGIIESIDNRNILGGWLPGRDRYAIEVKGGDGKTKKITFKTKQEFTDYIKAGSPAAAKKAPLD